MHWKWLAFSFGGLSLVLILVGVRYVRLPPRSYLEAVMQALDARQIPYDDVVIDHFCPPSTHCFGIGTVFQPMTADVTVSGRHPAHGQMQCARRSRGDFWTNCVLSMPAFDIRNLPLPPLEREIPWLAWLEHYWRAAQGWWKH